MAIKLKDIVSDETLRSQLPFVTDLEKERVLIAQQKLERLEMQMFPQTSILPTDVMDVEDEDVTGFISAVDKNKADLAKQNAIKTATPKATPTSTPKVKDAQANKTNGMNTNNLQKKKVKE